MQRRTDWATVIVVLVALPLLALSTAILAAAFSLVGRDEQEAAPKRAAEAPVTGAVSPPAKAAPPAAPSGKKEEPQPSEPQPSEPTPSEPTPSEPTPVKKEKQSTNAAATRPVAAPLADFYDREAYNYLRELKALVESQAWAEAARLVLGFDRERAPGVAPWIGEEHLAVSLPVAAQLAHAEYPQMRAALGEQYETLATLRLAEAIRAGDAARIEMATAQFAGARATAEAHAWLGDEALAGGRFSRALVHYGAAGSADAAIAEGLAGRQRLAAAMLGRNLGAPAKTDIKLGEQTLSAVEFETIVAGALARNDVDAGGLERSEFVAPPPGISRLQSRIRGSVEGMLPPADRRARTRALWPRVQVTSRGNVAYVASTQHVTAYDLDKHKVAWRTEISGTRHGRAADFSFHVERPVVHAGRVVVRLVRDQEPRVCSFAAASGALEWTAETREGETIVAGPVLLDEGLVALRARRESGGRRTLDYCTIDLQSGDIVTSRELAPASDEWNGRDCTIASHETGLVAAVGPMTLGIGDRGEVRWLRSLPADKQPREPGCVVSCGEAVITQSGGSSEIQCWEAATGRRRWSSEMPAETWILGTTSESVILSTPAGGFTWLNAADGKVAASCRVADFEPGDLVEAVLPMAKRTFAFVSRRDGINLDVVELEAAPGTAESRFLRPRIRMEFPPDPSR